TRVLERASLAAPSGLEGDLAGYHTYDEMMAELSALASAFPLLARLDTIGTSHEGRLLVAIKISDQAAMDEDEPEVFIMGCHHARELMSVEIPLMLAQYLLGGYGTNPQITDLVDGREVWIAPMINPDGHVYVENNNSGDWWTWWRKNRRNNGDGTFGVDLNRNYGYQWGYDDAGSSPSTSSAVYRGPAPFSEPETQAVRDFCNAREFALALSYHSYSELIIHPWAYDAIYTEDHELFTVLGDSLARGNGFAVGCTATDILYPTNGDSDDWMYGDTSSKNRIFSYTIELNSYEQGGFAPPDDLIQPTFDLVLELNLTLLRRAGEPRSVLVPLPPRLYPVEDIADPYHLISWSEGALSDPNPPVSWELVEYRDFAGATDPGSADGNVWTFGGFALSGARFYTVPESYYSGRGDARNAAMTLVDQYPYGILGASFSCRLWYDIETNWDYAYLEASLDGGLTWGSVPGNLTTDYDPNGTNRGNGITGSSGGWVSAEFFLDQIGGISSGSTLLLRFAYVTDASVNGEGIYIDEIDPVPGYAERNALAAAHPDTFFVREPPAPAEYAYVVRASDAEGHASRWSGYAFTVVSDVTGEGIAVPAASSVSGSYPNPFNPSTAIRLVVGAREGGAGRRAPVRVSIFDVAGRRVAVPFEGDLPAGAHTVRWDGRGADGRPLAGGVYFARCAIGEHSFTRKLVLIR
ncbi:MAG: M14 family zinc carboxypeptidase, partial [Candidatus Krumholzibacteria bacterium]|nr:M14 family zinc carboxypeptidase [Candidatus Krumholzibacteria bacterium]